MADFFRDIELPSKAKFYNGKIPKVLTIRTLNHEEEKMLYGSVSTETVNEIMTRCITKPEGIDSNELTPDDKAFVMFNIRVFTYGGDYHILTTCPYCNRAGEFFVSLEDLENIELDDSFEYPIKVTLPICKDELELRVLTHKDLNSIKEKIEKTMKNSPKADYNSLEYDYKGARTILTVNGETLPWSKSIQYYQDLHPRDNAYIRSKLEKINYGYQDFIKVKCTCGKEFIDAFKMRREFFFPRYDD